MRYEILLIFVSVLILSSCFSPFADTDFPEPTGFVNDFENVLTGQEENTLTEIVQTLETKTTAEIAIVTLRTVKPLSIEEYSVRLFEKWGIGKKDKDNGVLLLVAIDDREVKIEVGYGLEGVLPDGLCGEIIRNAIIPEFKKGLYGNGIIAGVNEIAGVISGGKVGYRHVSSPESVIITGIINIIGGFVIILFIVIFIFIAVIRSFLPHRRHWSTGSDSGSWGGFSGGGFGGFGGFGGGSSGGGGAVGRW